MRACCPTAKKGGNGNLAAAVAAAAAAAASAIAVAAIAAETDRLRQLALPRLLPVDRFCRSASPVWWYFSALSGYPLPHIQQYFL